MIILVAIAGAAALGLSTALPPQSAPDPSVDPVVGALADMPPAQRQRFLAEPRNQAWATPAEAALTTAYKSIDGVAPTLRVRCASTLCEVAGHAVASDQAGVNRIMAQLQGSSLQTTLSAAGLHSLSQSFGGAGKTDIDFVAYWASAKP